MYQIQHRACTTHDDKKEPNDTKFGSWPVLSRHLSSAIFDCKQLQTRINQARAAHCSGCPAAHSSTAQHVIMLANRHATAAEAAAAVSAQHQCSHLWAIQQA
jgi:hypothetical protein